MGVTGHQLYSLPSESTMHSPRSGGKADTEAEDISELIRLKGENPKPTTSANDNVPKWKRIWKKNSIWIIAVVMLTIISIALLASLIACSNSYPSSPEVPPCHNESNGSTSDWTNRYTDGTENKTCDAYECVLAAYETLSFMNKSVEPCDDFYEFACGRFAKSTVLSNEGGSRSVANIISELYQQQLKAVLQESGSYEDLKAFDIARNFYKICMNTTAIDEIGLVPLRNLLRQLGRWPLLEDNWAEESFDWLESIVRVRKLGYMDSYFIGIAADKKLRTPRSNMIVLDQATLGIPRTFLVQGMENDRVKAYLAYMIDIAEALGINRARATTALTGALKFQIELAHITLPEDDYRKTSTRLIHTVSEMDRLYPLREKWEMFINSLLPSDVHVKGDEPLLVLAPGYLRNVERIINSTSKKDQANYAMWRLIDSSVKYSTTDVREKYAKLQAKINPGYRSKPRLQECIDTVIEKMPISIGALYTQKYLSEEKATKKTAMEIVTNIKTQLGEAAWMDEETRDIARQKAMNMTLYVGYPDEYLDDEKIDDYYSELEVNWEEFNGYVLTLNIFETKKSFRRRRNPDMKDDWTLHPFPTEANVAYDFTDNVLHIPSGVLQGRYFDPAAPQHMNYGALGFLVGHELTHGFIKAQTGDDLPYWWSKETKSNYSLMAECIVDQYSNYVDESSSLELNGVNTREANIADNAAIKEAYVAYTNRAQKDSMEKKLVGLDYTPSQLFWVSAASVLCTKYDREALKREIRTGMHSPAKYRVIGSLSNMDEFRKDFDCSTDSPMNREEQCHAWQFVV